MFTKEELSELYQRILVTPPFNNCMGRFTDEINKRIAERIKNTAD